VANINNKKQNCEIVTVCGGVLVGGGEGEWRRLRWGNMVDGLHIPTWTRTKKPLTIALSGAGRDFGGTDNGGNETIKIVTIMPSCIMNML
jgi:hypothetical protein